MNVVRIMGGLGNQMFQYAHAMTLPGRVEFDLSWYKSGNIFPLLIDKAFNITLPVCGSPVKGPKYIRGYWESENYFEDIIDLVRDTFTFKDASCNPMPKNAVAIHIRRGDKVSNANTKAIYGVCSEDYFKRAMDYVAERITHPMFLIYTDDPEWARDKFGAICNSVSAIRDMEGMSRCEHNIISNSTFGWWGAWLNNNPDKIIIAPKKWYLDRDEKDIVPGGWVRI